MLSAYDRLKQQCDCLRINSSALLIEKWGTEEREVKICEGTDVTDDRALRTL